MKIDFAASFCEKYIDSTKTVTQITPISCSDFRQSSNTWQQRKQKLYVRHRKFCRQMVQNNTEIYPTEKCQKSPKLYDTSGTVLYIRYYTIVEGYCFEDRL